MQYITQFIDLKNVPDSTMVTGTAKSLKEYVASAIKIAVAQEVDIRVSARLANEDQKHTVESAKIVSKTVIEVLDRIEESIIVEYDQYRIFDKIREEYK